METSILDVFVVTLRVLFCSLFLIAGMQKLADPGRFRAVLSGYKLLPETVIGVTGMLLPIVELLIAILVMVPSVSVIGVGAALALLVIYVIALGSVVARNIDIDDCGCGRSTNKRGIGAWPLVRNALLVVAAIFVMIFYDPLIRHGLAGWSIILPFSAFVMMFYWTLDALLMNIQFVRASHE